ncbi:MAG TPA: type II toxin-antitoxin system prevent-host-death family antitoxin [Anaerolineae bacterium]|nr:type II toxin-antitoxin system prevent-host-death family antitoxin [Anaerolineae bacterium]
MQATAKDLRFNVKELLDAVTRGEEIIITYRGQPRAKLIPYENQLEEENDLFGIWADYPETENVNEYVRKKRYQIYPITS